MIFTYTDKDGYVPPFETEKRLTTGDSRVFSYLEEAVVNMPRRTASSSGGGKAKQATKSAGMISGGADGGVSETAAVIQTHLVREDNFKASRSAACSQLFMKETLCDSKARTLSNLAWIPSARPLAQRKRPRFGTVRVLEMFSVGTHRFDCFITLG